MFNKSKKVLAFLCVMTLVLLAGGCAAAPAAGSSAPAPAADAAAPAADAGGKINVLFWHAMSGTNGEQITKIVDGFNASQDVYFVTAEVQGAYDESVSKFFNMNLGEGSPALIQIGEQNLQSMIDSTLVESVSDLMDKHGLDKGELLPQAIDFYSVDGHMYAMPFNTSAPLLYYNTVALQNAGLDDAPETFEGILAAGEAISAANDGMKAFSKPVYGYALEQMVTNMGGLVVNNENGRADRATEVAYQPQMKVIFDWIGELIAADQFINYGNSQDDIAAGFNQGDIAMFITTSARAASIISGAPFEVGIAALPLPEGVERQGIYAAGGAVCVAKDLADDVQAGAMEFLKYATSAEVQATWSGGTGYFPVNPNSYSTETMKAIYATTPQLEIAAQSLLNSKQTVATAGPLLSLLPQLRNDLQTAEESIFNGGDVDEALAGAVSATNAQIETANKSVA